MKRAAKAGIKSFQEAVAKKIEPPPELSYLLVWYDDIRNQNNYGFRFEPISHEEIRAYRDLYKADEIEMDGFDVWMLTRLDGIWRSVQPKPDAPSKPPKGRR